MPNTYLSEYLWERACGSAQVSICIDLEALVPWVITAEQRVADLESERWETSRESKFRCFHYR
jgi:hypothetical protein